jgi:hypothetical protein
MDTCVWHRSRGHEIGRVPARFRQSGSRERSGRRSDRPSVPQNAEAPFPFARAKRNIAKDPYDLSPNPFPQSWIGQEVCHDVIPVCRRWDFA